jgi:hypothetical protein
VAALAAVIAAPFLVRYYRWHSMSVDEVLKRTASLDSATREKICAHRSNNVPMYRQAVEHFDCVEIDVHLSPPTGGLATVYHPPETNNHGLTLRQLLTEERLPTGRLWLDVKDMNAGNWPSFLGRLSAMIPAARHGDVIVETPWSSPEVAQAAAAFRKAGFAFSYYLPMEEAMACDRLLTRACDELRGQVIRTVAMGFSHLSFDARAYPFVKSIRDALPEGTGLLTWDLSRFWPKAGLVDEVEIYIVDFPSPYSDRLVATINNSG